nr:hypothetical protein [Corynebacterium glutamicum]
MDIVSEQSPPAVMPTVRGRGRSAPALPVGVVVAAIADLPAPPVFPGVG